MFRVFRFLLRQRKDPSPQFWVLVNLPNLTHPSLEPCWVANPPPHFPHSFPSLSPKPVDTTINNLTLSDFPGGILATPARKATPAAATAPVRCAPSRVVLRPCIHRPAALLRRAPAPLVKVDTFSSKTQDALELIDAASGAPLHTIELRIENWDDEVLLAVAHSLRAYQDVWVMFRCSLPRREFYCEHTKMRLTLRRTSSSISILGVAHLPLLPHLDTLHLHAIPPLEIFENDGGLRRTSAAGDYNLLPDSAIAPRPRRAVVPDEEDCANYLGMWNQYNAELKRAN
ncbi:hypothetical protein B0H19DRAFT_1235385 [Mycena capillaripes]|nr:hypothetical protein B0H19DRAFT_1235385 [Mycena capillaripes]